MMTRTSTVVTLLVIAISGASARGLPGLSSTQTAVGRSAATVGATPRGGGRKAVVAAPAPSPPSPPPASHPLATVAYFSVWYLLNVLYNIQNKQVLNELQLPWLVSVAQLGVGALFAQFVWLLRLRQAPKLTTERVKKLAPIGAAHGVGQALTVLSLGAGAVSFTHVVKALEPFFSAIVSAVAVGEIFKAPVYAALLPVVGGVSLAVCTDLSFNWLSFGTALSSNLAFACRAVYSKLAMTAGTDDEAPLSAANLFGVITTMAFLGMAPIAVWLERKTMLLEVAKALGVRAANVAAGLPSPGFFSDRLGPAKALAVQVVLSGLLHYTNNEVMFLTLSKVHPITLAVGNTLKRVIIIVASLIVFRNPISPIAAVGTAIGISGVLLYSLAKQHYGQATPPAV